MLFSLRGCFRYGYKGSKAREREYPVKGIKVEANSHVEAIAKLTNDFQSSSGHYHFNNTADQHTNLRFDGTSYEMDGGKILSQFKA